MSLTLGQIVIYRGNPGKVQQLTTVEGSGIAVDIEMGAGDKKFILACWEKECHPVKIKKRISVSGISSLISGAIKGLGEL